MNKPICRTTEIFGKVNLTIKTVKPCTLKETGYVQFFYHSPSSKLPIRDVLNEQGAGHKKEPHIEIGAENYWINCYQKNIKKFAGGRGKYLFLITTCRNKEVNQLLGQERTQFIVGYIIKNQIGESKIRVFVKGKTYLYAFEDAIPVRNIFGKNFSQSELKSKTISLVRHPSVSSEKAKMILGRFKGKKNVISDCVEEIKRLDKNNNTCLRLKNKTKCIFKDECLRWHRK